MGFRILFWRTAPLSAGFGRLGSIELIGQRILNRISGRLQSLGSERMGYNGVVPAGCGDIWRFIIRSVFGLGCISYLVHLVFWNFRCFGWGRSGWSAGAGSDWFPTEHYLRALSGIVWLFAGWVAVVEAAFRTVTQFEARPLRQCSDHPSRRSPIRATASVYQLSCLDQVDHGFHLWGAAAGVFGAEPGGTVDKQWWLKITCCQGFGRDYTLMCMQDTMVSDNRSQTKSTNRQRRHG